MTWQTIKLSTAAPEPILALGAYLKNTVGMWHGHDFVYSPNHGDLGTPESRLALDDSVKQLIECARASGARIAAVAHDLHPDFYSTTVAMQLADEYAIPVVAVQHHVAHIAAVQAEQMPLTPVIGIAMDGTGFGLDGGAWGGELILSQSNHWQRLGHLSTLAMPGGDIAARESWRMAASALHAAHQSTQIENMFSASVGENAARMVSRMLEQKLNCPQTSSAGRWFDAAAAILGLNIRQSFEAEAAICLERAAQSAIDAMGEAGYDVLWQSSLAEVLQLKDMTRCLDLSVLVPRLCAFAQIQQSDEGALYFHIQLAARWVRAAQLACAEHDIDTVALSGGCFFNRILRVLVVRGLESCAIKALLPKQHSCGDAGLPLGQAWVAWQHLNKLREK